MYEARALHPSDQEVVRKIADLIFKRFMSAVDKAAIHSPQSITTTAPAAEIVPDQGVRKLLTYREAAHLLGLTDRTIFNLVRKGELRGVKIGIGRNGLVRIDPRDLDEYIAACKERP
jgi:excisionase family DNA binding protein